MSVDVHKEPSEMNCWPKENCCVCRTPTSYWYGTGPLNVALCPTCATRATADSLPTKAQWTATWASSPGAFYEEKHQILRAWWLLFAADLAEEWGV